jgi:ABC-type multidrug transport system fused ATPase/permease subunit
MQRTSLLRMRASDGGGGALVLAEAVRESVLYEAIGVPHIIGRVLALGTLLAVALLMLPVEWVLLGGGVVVATLALGALLQRRLQRAQRVVWDGFANVVEQATLLTGATMELRAHAREQSVADELSRGVKSMARGERNASALSAMSGFVPATIALLALAAPVRAGAQWAIHMLGGAGLARLGVIGATAAAVAIGLVRAVDLRVRSAPGRKALAVFLSRAEPPSDSVVPGSAVPSLATATIAFERASLMYPNASEATPHEFDHVWRSEARGLVVTGDNGAGKSTLALMLLGLLEPTSGRITLDGKPICDFDADEYRRRIVYVPQRPFVAEGASVGWHIRYLSGESLSPARVRSALRRFGLWEKLEDHARSKACDPEDVPLESLSGGEQKRLHLARALAQPAELIVLDEPEAGIDQDGRRMLREVCDELTVNARVLLIAHDETIIPSSFARVRCTRGLARDR